MSLERIFIGFLNQLTRNSWKIGKQIQRCAVLQTQGLGHGAEWKSTEVERPECSIKYVDAKAEEGSTN